MESIVDDDKRNSGRCSGLLSIEECGFVVVWVEKLSRCWLNNPLLLEPFFDSFFRLFFATNAPRPKFIRNSIYRAHIQHIHAIRSIPIFSLYNLRL